MNNNNYYENIYEKNEVNFNELKAKFEELKTVSIDGYEHHDILRHQQFIDAIEECLILIDSIRELQIQNLNDESEIMNLLEKFHVVKDLCLELNNHLLTKLDMLDLVFIKLYLIPSVNYKLKAGVKVKVRIFNPKELQAEAFADDEEVKLVKIR